MESGRFGVLLLTAFDVLARRQMTERAVGPLVIVVVAPGVQECLGVREAWLDRARHEARTYTVALDGKYYDFESDRPPTEAEARTAIQPYLDGHLRVTPASSRWVGALGLSVLYGTGLYLLIGLLRVTAWSLRTVRR